MSAFFIASFSMPALCMQSALVLDFMVSFDIALLLHIVRLHRIGLHGVFSRRGTANGKADDEHARLQGWKEAWSVEFS